MTAKWILFEKLPRKPGQVTDRWDVQTMAGVSLGEIKWFGRWRQYAFNPADATVFERRCLRDIDDKCEAETAARRTLPRLKAEEKGEAFA